MSISDGNVDWSDGGDGGRAPFPARALFAQPRRHVVEGLREALDWKIKRKLGQAVASKKGQRLKQRQHNYSSKTPSSPQPTMSTTTAATAATATKTAATVTGEQ